MLERARRGVRRKIVPREIKRLADTATRTEEVASGFCDCVFVEDWVCFGGLEIRVENSNEKIGWARSVAYKPRRYS